MHASLKNYLALAGLTSALFLSACSKRNDSMTPDYPPANPPLNTPGSTTGLAVKSNASFGNILTDANGKALYFFALDPNGTSNCTGGCAMAWPIYYAGNEAAPAGTTSTDIATITRADGQKQTTYKGWPLYYYAGDTKASEINGDGSGGTWFIAKPDYSIMLANNQLTGLDGRTYLANSSMGTGITQYLTDANGRTLYAYAPDTFNTNTFTKADLSNNSVWPIYESAPLNVPSVLKKEMFVQINAVGKKQLTYKGHPLYFFGSDTKRGDNKGVSVPTPGVWPILTLTTAALNGAAGTN